MRVFKRERLVCDGFTLVELLVVVAIIALLLAVMLPALGRARRAARSAICRTHLAELGRQTHLFATEHNGELPRSLHSAGAGFVNGEPWEYAFGRQISGGRVLDGSPLWWNLLNGLYHCPFDPRRSPLRVGDRLRGVFSYGYNVYYELTGQETATQPGQIGPTWRRLSQVPHPAATVLFGELHKESGPMVDHAMAHFWTLYDAPPEIATDRHDPDAGYAWLDGHASETPFRQTFDPDRDVNRWNPAAAR